MASPEAVMRAAQMKPPMGGMGGGEPPAMEPKPPAAEPQAPQAGAGLDQMVETLQGVGQFLQSQGPAGQKAMTHFTALLQEMASLGGGQQPQAPEEGSRRIPADQFPGVQVL